MYPSSQQEESDAFKVSATNSNPSKLFNGATLDSNNDSMVASQESSLTAQGLITYNKTILVRPDELTFSQVTVNQAQSQVVTMQNTLSAPVEIVLKSSSHERLDLAPKNLRLQPHETCQVTVTFRQPRPFPAKTLRQKETIFIKSDFFDQKVTVNILPASTTTSEANSSLQRAPAAGRNNAFQQATVSMSRQQLATTTIGKTLGAFKSPKQASEKGLGAFEDHSGLGGQNDSFGRATASDFANGDSEKIQQRRQEFDPIVQASSHVEVTLAADSQANIVSAIDQGVHNRHQFESHETNLLKQQLNEISAQNHQLRSELAEQQRAGGVPAASTETDHIDQIKVLLREREPKLEELLEEAIKVERAGQKLKDAKVLDILQFKDKQLQELTQAHADHKIVQQVMQDQNAAKLQEAQERLRQYEGNEDRFQDLLLSQNKINEQTRSIHDLQTELASMKNEVGTSRQTKAFYEESLERAKTQATLYKGKLDACEADLGEERDKTESLESQIGHLQAQLGKLMASNHSDMGEQARSLDHENTRLKERVFRMEDQLQQVFKTLGKVTGDGQYSVSKASTVMHNSEEEEQKNPLAQSSGGFDEKLQQRAEEIVLIVEQVQMQYTILEKELRSLVEKGPARAALVQTDLASADIDDIYGHYEQMRDRLVQAQGGSQDADHQLNEAKQTIDRLQDELRTFTSGDSRKQQVWLDGGVSQNSNELLTNRNSSSNQDQREIVTAPANVSHEILVSERGGMTQRNRLALSSINNSQTAPIVTQYTTTNAMQLNTSGNTAVVREIQEREHQLLDQLSMLKEQMRFQTSHSDLQTVNGANDPSAFANEHLQLRMAELETLVFQQREHILELQDHNGGLKQQLDDKIEENRTKMELYELRNHNLQELNRKYQEASKQSPLGYASGSSTAYVNTYATTQRGNDIQSPPIALERLNTEVGFDRTDVERVKQYAQEQEMKVMDLSHGLKEAKVSLKHAQQTKAELQTKLTKAESGMARMNQDQLLVKAGMNVNDSKLAMLVTELKMKIKKLEAESQKSIQVQNTQGNTRDFSNNQQLQGQISSTLYALREEYCTKLEKLVEANTEERSELQSQSLVLLQKAEASTAQLKAVEDKEMRLFSQLEEIRSQKSLEEEHLQNRIRDQSSMLDQKQQVCADLEREINQKDKMLSERQEQLSILLSAMESQSQADGVTPLGEARQKLATMAAELCSLKAIEAQMERRCAEITHKETQASSLIQKLENQLADSQVKVAMLSRKVETKESSNELLERQKQDLGNRVEEVDRDKSDHQYKLERLQFQLKTKEETIECMRTQAINSERHFKEQVDRIREDLLMRQPKSSPSYPTMGRNREGYGATLSATPGGRTDTINSNNNECHMREHRPRHEVALKIAIQQLHLVIADYIERSGGESGEMATVEEAQKNIIAEMEKALNVAQTTIQRLEGDLDRERTKTEELSNEWDALALNGILVTRQERMTSQLKTISRLLSDREVQSTNANRTQLDQLNRAIRQQEQKSENDAQVVAQLDQEAQGLKLANKRLLAENEELQATTLCYSQEQQAMLNSLEKKAQISVDERHRQRSESIKVYFEQQINKILLQTGSAGNEQTQGLSRELAAHQLLADKHRRQIDMVVAERDGLESTVRFLKAAKEDHEAKLRDQVSRAATDQAKLEAFESGANTNVALSRRKQECLTLEKELIKEREAFEMKSREVTTLLQRIESQKFDNMQKQVGSDLDTIAKRKTDGAFDEAAQQKIQSLQESLMEIRGGHIQELEELKVQCDVDVSEARREMSQQQRQFESKFMPGTAPGEILDQNHELRERISKLQVEVDHLCQDSDGMRAQLFDKDQQLEMLSADLQDRDQAFADLEQAASAPLQSQQPLKSALKKKAQIDIDGGLPSAIIRQLFNAKRAELYAKQKLRAQLQIETKLRQQVSGQLQEELSVHHFDQTQNNTFGVIGEDVVNQLMAQNANILSILQDGAGTLNTLGEYTGAANDEEGTKTVATNQDYVVLIQAVIYFANQQALKSVQTELYQQDLNLLQRAPLTEVIEAQRIVIRALSERHSADRIRYGPEGELDRKVWYLELLEEQVSDCDRQTTKLQDFVKRLQIGVSGSLHSAAEIKASSMDLAQHLKMASEEVKTLRNVTGLIKHDVLNLQQTVDDQQSRQPTLDVHNMSMAASCQDGAFNPFLTGAMKQHAASTKTLLDPSAGGELQTAHLQQTQRSHMERMLNEHDSVQNQLNLTSKIKQSLENELVQSKLAHASEMQQVIQKMSNAERRIQQANLARSQMDSEKNKAEELVVQQDEELAELKVKLVEVEQSMQGAKLEAAKATSSSKQWQKMQNDMQDWRRSHEESIRAKQKQVVESQDKAKQLKADKKRMKAEVQMLRQNQRVSRDGSAAGDQMKKENELLVQRFNEQLDERKKEIEFWVQERAQMRDKIDELESGAVGQMNMFNMNEAAVADGDDGKQDKLVKKLKSRELELKSIKSDLLEKKNLFSKAELKNVKLDAKLREATTGLVDSENKVTLLTNRTKELEIEKEMLVQRQRDQIRTQDMGADQINTELDKLREEFARVRVERDELQIETQRANEREKKWRDTIEKLSRDVNSLQNNLALKESECSDLRSLSDKKHAALLSDLKFMRDENQKLHVKLKEANECVLLLEQQVAQVSHERSEQELAQDSLKRKLDDNGDVTKAKDLRIAEAQAQLQAVETAHYHRIKQLQATLIEVKGESSQTCQLLQAQIEQLKARLLSDKKASSKEIELSLALTQKEASVKLSKKELNTAKTQITTLKCKVKELKQSLDEIPQRQVPQSKAMGGPPRRNKAQPAIEQQPETVESVFRRKLADIEGLDELLQAANEVAGLETQITDGQLQLSKVENWNYALSQQLEEAKVMLEQLEEKIYELNKEKKEMSKAGRQVQAQNEKQLKEQLKSLVAEVEKIRQEWSSPQAVAQQQDQVVQLSIQVKSLQAEIARKSKHLGQVKQQKEQTSKEQSQVQTELTQLKDDNTKLKAQIREASKTDKQSRDLRSQVEWITKSEKRLKEEILSLNEKLKSTRSELSRKDQHLKDYRDRMDMIQSEVSGKTDLEGELGKLRDLNRRQRLDLESKENQVRTLRGRIEQNHVEINALSEEKVNQAQQDTQLGAKLKDQKQKTRRYEANMQKSVSALKKIGVELASLHQNHQRSDSKQSAATFGGILENDRNQPIPVYKRTEAGNRSNDNPMAFDDLEKEAEYFKTGVEILGLSMNEMESFINPKVNAAATIEASYGHNIADSPTSLISSRGQRIARTTANAGLLERLERLDGHHVDQSKIEEIGDYCVRMLSDMANK